MLVGLGYVRGGGAGAPENPAELPEVSGPASAQANVRPPQAQNMPNKVASAIGLPSPLPEPPDDAAKIVDWFRQMVKVWLSPALDQALRKQGLDSVTAKNDYTQQFLQDVLSTAVGLKLMRTLMQQSQALESSGLKAQAHIELYLRHFSDAQKTPANPFGQSGEDTESGVQVAMWPYPFLDENYTPDWFEQQKTGCTQFPVLGIYPPEARADPALAQKILAAYTASMGVHELKHLMDRQAQLLKSVSVSVPSTHMPSTTPLQPKPGRDLVPLLSALVAEKLQALKCPSGQKPAFPPTETPAVGLENEFRKELLLKSLPENVFTELRQVLERTSY